MKPKINRIITDFSLNNKSIQINYSINETDHIYQLHENDDDRLTFLHIFERLSEVYQELLEDGLLDRKD